MKLSYTDRARADLETAFIWYEQQRHRLGHEFLDCVEMVIAQIEDMPKVYNIYHEQFRRALLKRFPFAVFYTIEKTEIIIHAIFDTRQNPAKLP